MVSKVSHRHTGVNVSIMRTGIGISKPKKERNSGLLESPGGENSARLLHSQDVYNRAEEGSTGEEHPGQQDEIEHLVQEVLDTLRRQNGTGWRTVSRISRRPCAGTADCGRMVR